MGSDLTPGPASAPGWADDTLKAAFRCLLPGTTMDVFSWGTQGVVFSVVSGGCQEEAGPTRPSGPGKERAEDFWTWL